MDLTPEIEQLIEEKAKIIAEEKTQEIVKQITEESEKKIEKLNAEHTAEIKTYKDSITAIISGKQEQEEEKPKMQILVDSINEKRKLNIRK